MVKCYRCFDKPVKVRYLFRKPRRSCVFNEAGLPLGAFQFGAPELDEFMKDEAK